MTPEPLPRFGGDDIRPATYAQARVAILPVPYEGTVSYGGGTSHGPRAILAASEQLEWYDEELDASPAEQGICTLPAPALEGLSPAQAMAAVHQAALPPLRDGKLLGTLGGEHSISLGVFTALRAAGHARFHVLQIDAHGDLRPSYHGTPHSHASIMARVHELGLPFVQVGLRAVSAAEREFLRGTGLERNVFWMHRIAASADEAWMDEVLARLGSPLYITVDVDGLDPAIMPATGTPEPGGLQWWPLLRLLRRAAEAHRVIGFDVVELAPLPGLHAPDFLAARLVYKLIGYALRNR